MPGHRQETFIRAYRAIPQFRGESAFYPWLYRIAVNTARSLVDLKRDPIVTDPHGLRVTTTMKLPRIESDLSHGETPEALLASKNCGRRERLHRSAV